MKLCWRPVTNKVSLITSKRFCADKEDDIVEINKNY